MRFFRNIFVSITICVSWGASAAIIENDVNLADTYKDTDTNLVWMDFGVNNLHSYDYVASNTGSGGAYDGWRLPTAAEVYTMWSNVSDVNNVLHDYAYADNEAIYVENEGGDSLLQSVFDVMGFNTIAYENTADSHTDSYGWYMGTSGLSYVRMLDYVDASGGYDTAELYDYENLSAAYTARSYGTSYLMSTLLVRDGSQQVVASIPEPSIFFLFALAFLGCAASRKNKVK